MLSTLRDLSTSLNNSVRKVEGFYVSTTQTIPGSGNLQPGGWSIQPGCGQFKSTLQLDLSDGVYTAPVDGYYNIGVLFNFTIDPPIEPILVQGEFQVNGDPHGSTQRRACDVTFTGSLSPTGLVQLQQGDQVTVNISVIPGHTAQLDSRWGIFLQEKTGSQSLRPPLSPVSKILTNFPRVNLGFFGQFFPKKVDLTSTPTTLTGWCVSENGNWNSGSLNPATGIFTVPRVGYYHVLFTIIAVFSFVDINFEARITSNDSCILLPHSMICTVTETQTILFGGPQVVMFFDKPGQTLKLELTSVPDRSPDITAFWAIMLHQ